MSRAIVNVATGSYVTGQARLRKECADRRLDPISWSDKLPLYSPPHSDVPYAFKAWALKAASELHGKTTLVWADACIRFGERPIEDLFKKIEDEGIWFANNGFSNYEWTADSAYADLFPAAVAIDLKRAINKTIPHVVATAFGLDLTKPIARNFLAEYLRLAQTDAFRGPWTNWNYHGRPAGTMQADGIRCAPCGPSDVRGHRHDQTAASVICWKLGVHLSECPEWFSYAGGQTEKTCLIADGNYA